jgi:DNA-binding ferritin-like protein
MVTNDKTATPTDLSGNAVEEITSNLRRLLADVFALYVKTKNFHWHITTCCSTNRPRRSSP